MDKNREYLEETNVFPDCEIDGSVCDLVMGTEIEFQGEGWYKNEKNIVLIVRHLTAYKMYIWKDFDPRPLFNRLLELSNYDRLG